MKKFIALLLSTIICLSFVACDKSDENTENTTQVEQESANSVKLTPENFETYFEYVERPIFTRVDSDKINSFQFRYFYKLRSKYEIDYDKSSIELTYKHASCTRDIDIDFTNPKFTLGDNIKNETIINNVKINKFTSISDFGQAIMLNSPEAVQKGANTTTYYYDFVITDVKGTLYFVNE